MEKGIGRIGQETGNPDVSVTRRWNQMGEVNKSRQRTGEGNEEREMKSLILRINAVETEKLNERDGIFQETWW